MLGPIKRLFSKRDESASPVADPPEQTHCTLFVPGTPGNLEQWRSLLEVQGLLLSGDTLHGAGLAFGAKVQWVGNPNDGSFGKAFSFGTASVGQQNTINAAPGALVLSIPVDLHRERAPIASLGHALSSCGALAVRIEESKLGYPVGRWLELMGASDPWTLYRAAVVVLESSNRVTTCGMQVFSLPDAQVTLDDSTDAREANALLGILNVYQIAEDPVLVSGHTFSPDAKSPRRVLHRWPDATYPPGNDCHNPFGVWRLGSPGSSGTAPKLAIVFIPSLASILMAAEKKAGQPLSQKDVEELTSKCSCITMEYSDAQALERRRGYADLDPERVWDQWQIVRGS